MTDDRIYFIRVFADVDDAHFQVPRSRETVRRSLDGDLCLLVFEPQDVPVGWTDGVDTETMRETLNAPDALGVWYIEDI